MYYGDGVVFDVEFGNSYCLWLVEQGSEYLCGLVGVVVDGLFVEQYQLWLFGGDYGFEVFGDGE